jgi:hypothetical protein
LSVCSSRLAWPDHDREPADARGSAIRAARPGASGEGSAQCDAHGARAGRPRRAHVVPQRVLPRAAARPRARARLGSAG